MNLRALPILRWFVILIGTSQLVSCASPSPTIVPSSPMVVASPTTATAVVTAASPPVYTTTATPIPPTATNIKATPVSTLTSTPVDSSVKFDAYGVLYEYLEDGTAQRVQPQIGDGSEARIAFNGDGAVWFLTDHGVSRVVNSRITHFADERAAIVAAFPWTGVQSLWPVAPDGTIWTLEGDKLIGYNGRTWLSIPIAGVSTDKIYHIAAGPGGLLAITSDSGLNVYTPKGGWQVPSLPASMPKDLWFDSNLVAGQDGSLWIGLDFMGDGGLLHYVPASQAWTVFDEKNSNLPQIGITGLAVASNGDIWVVNITRGILAVRHVGSDTWDYLTHGSPFPDTYGFGDVYFGPHGDLWLPTVGGCGIAGEPCWLGLAHYAKGVWKRYTAADGLVSDHVFAVAVDPTGTPWLATDTGLQRFQP